VKKKVRCFYTEMQIRCSATCTSRTKEWAFRWLQYVTDFILYPEIKVFLAWFLAKAGGIPAGCVVKNDEWTHLYAKRLTQWPAGMSRSKKGEHIIHFIVCGSFATLRTTIKTSKCGQNSRMSAKRKSCFLSSRPVVLNPRTCMVTQIM